MSEELKPCPFCGSLPKTKVAVTQSSSVEDHLDFSIYCPNCGTSKTVRQVISGFVEFLDMNTSMLEAGVLWNRRYEILDKAPGHRK